MIGAGWAGLSAAISLIHRADISLFEAGRQAGGRARAIAGKDDGFSFLDNGQHILLGAYHGVQTLMQYIGVQPESAFLRQPLQWYIHEGLQFQTASLPALGICLSASYVRKIFLFIENQIAVGYVGIATLGCSS